MRGTIFIFFAFLIARTYSQGALTSPNNECGTQLPVNYAQWRLGGGTVQNLITSLKHNVCLNKKISIVFYVVLDSAGLWGPINQSSLTTCITKLNNAFQPICVSFQQCTVVSIPNFNFNRWKQATTEIYVKQNYYTDETINIYLCDIILDPVGAAGYAYMPPAGNSLTDLIVLEKNAVTGNTPIHEMGHFFGLPHTFDEIGPAVVPPHPPGMDSYEFVARTNCYTNGDGFCDTEADCFSLPNGTQDGNGKYYILPTDNYMSYYPSPCRFTQEQYNFMATIIATQRLYLH